ncbi:hypothetical protein CBM2609_B90045 [Cupriavidus taiwanensis]|nr:hypothetical protein CBM2604_B80045 [Cupriavidus taiwanensis]SOZ33570.1 hypothetical protein CBM2609_B90045 [Cupriavidus taiwanensis]SOZ48844.1 hypothetical protein CBM2610_B70045 [Cupriavidus taiwanensis]
MPRGWGNSLASGHSALHGRLARQDLRGEGNHRATRHAKYQPSAKQQDAVTQTHDGLHRTAA